ncbi:uncharacterized protein L201_003778 [Kwoniella dendrophila CBS 6074]|uniref:ferric-chelate reductase (NADPH) n=1 Tax=Kwoniella dendrophila CBS 6074 TaxID=1295534 RepID=A0AAX4JVF3_9TREE
MTDHQPQQTFIMPSLPDDVSITATSSSFSTSILSPSSILPILPSTYPSIIPGHSNGSTHNLTHDHEHHHLEGHDGPVMYKFYVMPYSWYWIISVFLLIATLHIFRQMKHSYRKRRIIRKLNSTTIYKPILDHSDSDYSYSNTNTNANINDNEDDIGNDQGENQPLNTSQSSISNIKLNTKPIPNVLRRTITGLSATFRNTMYLRSFPWWLYGPDTVMDAAFTILYCTVYLYLCLHLADSWFPLRNDNIANRFGIMSFSQLPIILLLVSKNNPISSLTGITYQKLNYLHRASSRVCLLTSWGHAILWTPRVWEARDFRPYLLCGIAALLGFTMLWLTSFRFIRRMAYEFFLASHIIFTIMYLVGAWFHWHWLGQWVIPAMVIWIFDRFLRFAQVIYQNNFHHPTQWNSAGDCRIEMLDHDVLRVKITRDNFHWKAGQHAFISAPSISGLPHESHPFSIANVPTDISNEAYFLIRVHTGFTKRLHAALTSDLTTNIPLYIEGPYGYPHSLDSYSTVLLVAGGTGVTFVCGHFLQILQNVKKGKSAVKKLHLVWHIRHAEDIEWIAPLLNQGIQDSLEEDIDVVIDIYVTKTHSSDEPWPPELPVPELNMNNFNMNLNSINETLNEVGPRILALRNSENVNNESRNRNSWDEGCRTCAPTTPLNTESRDEGSIYLPKRQIVLAKYGLSSQTAEKVNWKKGRAKLNKIIQNDAESSDGPMNVSVCGPVQLLQAAKSAVREASNMKSCMEGLSSIDFFEETLGA